MSRRRRTISSGSTKISFLLRSPLYYVAVSTWGEPESVVRAHALRLDELPQC